MMKATTMFSLLAGLFLIHSCSDQSPSETTKGDYPITPVPFTQVMIRDNFWQPRLETNRTVTLPFAFHKSEETGRIRNFAIAGEMEEGSFEGIYFNDSDVFKIIEGASYSLQVHPDPGLKQYLDDLISKIAAAQEEDGYLYTNRTIDPSEAADGAGEKRWTNLKIHHELYNVGHMYEAAVAHFQATGERDLLDVAIMNADLVARVFGPGKNMGVPGHQEIEIGLVKLYRVTGDQKYLDLARFFVDQRGNAAGHDLYGIYAQDHLPFTEQEKAVGHAVRAGYFYAGATDVAAITGTSAYDEPLGKIWEDIVFRKIYLTGGIGAEPSYEGFGPDYELPNATAYTETCAAIALMLWNHRMFLLHGDVKYMDVFERTLYNGFLAGVSMEGNTFFYPNPLETDGINAFNKGVCGRSPWFDCSCCPVNVVRILPSVPGYIYATKGEDVYVNLFIGNEAEIDVNGFSMKMKQETGYPWDGRVEFTFGNEAAVPASFHIRVPGWLRNEVMPGDLYRYMDPVDREVRLVVNGKEEQATISNGYIRLGNQEWKKGDKVEVEFQMDVKFVVSHENVSAAKGKVALERGPVLYCAEAVDNPDGVLGLQIDPGETFEYSFDANLLQGVGKISGSAKMDGQPGTISVIPYYAWAHRQMGEMAVWFSLQ